MATAKAVLIYDGSCRICAGARAWIERRAIPGAFEFLACQSPERPRRYPALSEAACLEAMQLVLPDGRILAGDRAMPEILARLCGWRWLAAAFRLPGVGRLAPRAYSWIARNRYELSRFLPHSPTLQRGAEGRNGLPPPS